MQKIMKCNPSWAQTLQNQHSRRLEISNSKCYFSSNNSSKLWAMVKMDLLMPKLQLTPLFKQANSIKVWMLNSQIDSLYTCKPSNFHQARSSQTLDPTRTFRLLSNNSSRLINQSSLSLTDPLMLTQLDHLQLRIRRRRAFSSNPVKL